MKFNVYSKTIFGKLSGPHTYLSALIMLCIITEFTLVWAQWPQNSLSPQFVKLWHYLQNVKGTGYETWTTSPLYVCHSF